MMKPNLDFVVLPLDQYLNELQNMGDTLLLILVNVVDIVETLSQNVINSFLPLDFLDRAFEDYVDSFQEVFGFFILNQEAIKVLPNFNTSRLNKRRNQINQKVKGLNINVLLKQHIHYNRINFLVPHHINDKVLLFAGLPMCIFKFEVNDILDQAYSSTDYIPWDFLLAKKRGLYEQQEFLDEVFNRDLVVETVVKFIRLFQCNKKLVVLLIDQ